MRVHACIPHFALGAADQINNPQGYGSLRAEDQFQRALSLNRCLNGLGVTTQGDVIGYYSN